MTDLPDIKDFKFVCETCKETLVNAEIEVLKVDLSARYGGPEWSCTRNINYCRDKPRCLAGAKQLAMRENEETARIVKKREATIAEAKANQDE